MEAQWRKRGITFLKIALSAALIYFIFTKIDFRSTLQILKGANPVYLFIAFLLLAFSKVLASFRLNLYFHALSIFLSQTSNLKLYLLGMFYNLFLPGGIGGDAYKGYLIRKTFNISTKRVIAVLLLDRLSGLLLIFIYSCILAFFLEWEAIAPYKSLLAVAILAAIVVFRGLNKSKFSYVFEVFWRSAAYSSLVQLAQMISVIFILKSLGVESGTVAYLFLFLISSIVSVLPLTIGGIGSRELVFLYGALWFGLEENTSVAVSMIFFLMTAIVSFTGIRYHLKKPELVVQETSAS
ncbi:lysylphosphatidylglycerol synthase transmembrane domain-containing protein [Poritiphilus flavus]|uniref:Flippase-like domain-containing protein n=1 Tax=Poritiphilus flavus TaxID=2697053 RepID=A0A6L9E9Y7_9FLAO|nr:lysylphosphatidylglycerol synthase transmembrane domain-containing protein [Poritiphilus flavus]NAS11299.1 flippase-like domain-containing protein [Poritiphilus flavus]